MGNGRHWVTITCPTCMGTKLRRGKPCSLCEGKGTISVPPLDDKDED